MNSEHICNLLLFRSVLLCAVGAAAFLCCVTLSSGTAAALVCPPGTWACNDSVQCVNATARCNGVADCNDASDELSCNFTCSSNEFRCLTVNQCIRKEYQCDHGKLL